jgi:hypothetical protein
VRSTPEEIVRIAVVPDAAKPLPIFDVINGEQRHARIASDCEWAIVTHIPADSQGVEGYIVYYIDAEGWPGDKDEFDTLDEAFAQVERQTGIHPSSWRRTFHTRVEPNPFAQFDASLLRRLFAGESEPAV